MTGNAWAKAGVASKRVGLALALLLILYGLAGIVGGLLPRNAGWRPPAQGVRIFVESNGVHTGIVVPKLAAGVDWRGVVRADHLADPRYGQHDHLSFGWGERAFYVGTPTWADIRPGAVLAAAVGSDRTLLHVDHLAQPAVGPSVRAVTLRPEEYRRLTAYLRDAFARPVRRARGYGGFDVFYEARGRYSAVRTCNAWVGDALAHAGVRVGRWTPFPETVMWWF